MGSHLRSVKKNLHRYKDYQVLKRDLNDIPSNVKDYVVKNFSVGEAAQLGLDIAGIFDPSPVSDGLGALLALGRGDWLSLGTSVAGFIPYLGDTGKLGKWAKLGLSDKRYKYVADSINKYLRTRRALKAIAQSKALAKTKKEMWEYYQRYKRGDRCALCEKAAKKIKLPTHGKWKPGPPGAPGSKWFPDDASNLSDDMKDLINQKGGVPFSHGMPDYSDFAKELPPPGSGMKNLPFEMNGKGSDIDGSFSEYYNLMEANGTPMSGAAKEALESTHTWHHTDKGMQLVEKALHNPSLGGPSHVGARSWLSWPNY